MFIYVLSLRNWRRASSSVVLAVAIFIVLSQSIYASPGAHGPNGEHLDTSYNAAVSTNPKFESFTETFEILGELFEDQLVVYLHDFKSNVPVEGATIELESGPISASAEYSELLKAYVLTNQKMIQLLNTEGEHDLVLTIMTEDSDDLLSATLVISAAHGEHDHEEEHHHDFPWWTMGISILVFALGFFVGRLKKEKVS